MSENSGKNDFRYSMDLLFESQSLTRQQIEQLEVEASTKDSLEAHAQLAYFYEHQHFRDRGSWTTRFNRFIGKRSEPASLKKYREHALWIIQNAPWSSFADHMTTLAVVDREGCNAGSEIWIQHLSRNPTNADLHLRASKFFWFSDKTKSMELKRRACLLEPTESKHPNELASTFVVLAKWAPNEAARLQYLQSGLAYKEKVFELSIPKNKLCALSELCRYALAADDLEKATNFAQQIKEGDFQAEPYKRRIAIRSANLVLGRIALKRGDRSSAKDYLLESLNYEVESHWDFIRDLHGPEMDLANELLILGERATVLKFLARYSQMYPSFQFMRYYLLVFFGVKPKWAPDRLISYLRTD